MRTLIVALLGILVGGVAGAVVAASSAAQEAAKPADGDAFELVRRKREAQLRSGEALTERLILESGQVLQPAYLQVHGQPRTWEIVTARNTVILLNTATGATFRLVEKDDTARWEAIEGQFPRPETARAPAIRPSEWPDYARRIPVPPQVDKAAAEHIRSLEAEVRAYDALIQTFEARLKKDIDEAARKELEQTLARTRAEREKTAQALEKAKAGHADDQPAVPRGR